MYNYTFFTKILGLDLIILSSFKHNLWYQRPMHDKHTALVFDRRSAIFATGGAVLTSILVLRMVQLQIFGHRRYRSLSEHNITRFRVNIPERGRIFDNGGGAMARDEATFRIFIVPAETTDLESLLSLIERELNLRSRDMERLRTRIARQRRFQPAIVRNTVTWEQLAGLRTAGGTDGLHIERGFVRRYPGRTFASHLIGFVGGLDGAEHVRRAAITSPFATTGQAGLERTFENVLSGTPGQSALLVNAIGRIIGEDPSREVPAIPGKDIKTTINKDVQDAMEEALLGVRAGCSVAIEIDTGNIIAMASTPAFNPDDFRGDDGAEIIAALRNNQMSPFMNRTIEGLYQPGSTFKIVVLLAALEAGAILPTETVRCTGYWEHGRHRYHCWARHGTVNAESAMTVSCNIYFYQLALRIGIDSIRAMAERLGLMQRLLSDVLPRETIGVVPDREWKRRVIRQPWVHGDTILTGIGQGFVLTNCIQLAIMQARSVSNKRVVPRLIDDGTVPNFESMGFQRRNLQVLMNGLDAVVQGERGTARGSAINVQGMRMGGKTGTSQVHRITEAERETGVRTQEQLPWHLRNHGLFTAYAPTTNPKYVIATICEHVGGSSPAARATAPIMREILRQET
ncbi:MAG: penicillin-binding protein 2 [Alphaproteobacteria bacterium]|nr:penicillin-binding protein 2 [Alphaproteobacteria bacterium]